MLKTVVFALGFALVGVVLVPLIAFFGSLALFYAFDSQCGSPSDSGGCEMSAGVLAFAAAMPGLLIGMAAGVYFRRRRLQLSTTQQHGVEQRVTNPPAIEDDARPGLGGLAEAELDGLRRWAAGVLNVHRVWLVGARARGRYRLDSRADLVVEISYWDSPDPRDQLHASGIWFHRRAGWCAALEAVIPHSIRIWSISMEAGNDGELLSVPKEGQLIYERQR